jgi:hypothetical protein
MRNSGLSTLAKPERDTYSLNVPWREPSAEASSSPTIT